MKELYITQRNLIKFCFWLPIGGAKVFHYNRLNSKEVCSPVIQASRLHDLQKTQRHPQFNFLLENEIIVFSMNKNNQIKSSFQSKWVEHYKHKGLFIILY